MKPKLGIIYAGKSTSLPVNRFQEILVKREEFMNSNPTTEVQVSTTEFMDKYLPLFKEAMRDYDVKSIEDLLLAFGDFCENCEDIVEIKNFPVRLNEYYVLLNYENRSNNIVSESKVGYSIWDPYDKYKESNGKNVKCGCTTPYLYTDNYQCDTFEIVPGVWTEVGTIVTKLTYNCRYVQTNKLIGNLKDFGRWPLNQIHLFLNVGMGKDEIGVISLEYADEKFTEEEFLRLIDLDDNYHSGDNKFGLMYYNKFEFEDIIKHHETGIISIKPNVNVIHQGHEATIKIEFEDEHDEIIGIPDKEVFIWSNMSYTDIVERICKDYRTICVRKPGILYFNQDRAISRVDFRIRSFKNMKITVVVNGNAYVAPLQFC